VKAAMRELWDAPELSRWSIVKRLGQGGMGVVYLAHERASGDRRAIKFLRPDLSAASPQVAALFGREISICETLTHPNLVRSYLSGESSGGYFLVMEFCELGSLADIVSAGGPLPADVAVPLFLGILDGLHYAHSAIGVVHRDIKPQNILLSRNPEGGRIAKIGDFGLAKAYDTAGLSGMTKTGATSGTPAFMPREQVLNFKYALPAVDVWAVAATLYYVLTACTPRDFTPGRDPWLTVCTDPPIPIADRGVSVPPRLAALIDHAVRDDAEQQQAYVTAADFRAALAAIELP
jgi:serine/threonine protein kinase